jgi:hypothetical protein
MTKKVKTTKPAPKTRISLDDAEIVTLVETIKTYALIDASTTAVIKAALRQYVKAMEAELLK